MALRQISKLSLPNFERDHLSRSIASEMATVGSMTDTMLAIQRATKENECLAMLLL
jgi:hypothetical protein